MLTPTRAAGLTLGAAILLATTSLNLAYAKPFMIVGLDDVQSEATPVLHAGSAKDRAKRARCTALLPDDLANVGWSDLEPKHSCVLINNYLDIDCIGGVNQGFSDLNDESANLGDRV